MYIYVDESGSFAFPKAAASPSVCCVAALAIPDDQHQAIVDGFAHIVAGWRLPAGTEPKGSALTEKRVDRVITHLSNYDVVLVVVSIDMAIHTAAEIEAHKKGQAHLIRTSADGPEFKESMRQSVREVADRLEAVSNPLYVESVLLTQAAWRVTQLAKTQYAQSNPRALGRFAWRIDAKDRSLTEAEDLWSLMVKPMLQTISLRDGLISVRDHRFDYSALAPFENPVEPEAPSHLVRGMREGRTGPFHSVDIGKVMDSDRQFEDSAGSPGIQMADILANAFRRALNGRLTERGWRRLGRLLIRDFRNNAVQYVSLKPSGTPVPVITRQPYAQVARFFEQTARPWEVDPALRAEGW